MPRKPLPLSGRRAAQGALMVAVTLLQDERVRAQLLRAPAAARSWAARRRAAGSGAIGTVDGGLLATGRLDVTRRFGQKGLERRVAALRRNVELVFPEPRGVDGAAVERAVDELARATAVAGSLTGRERRRAQARITTELTRLETALVDAVLPPA